MQLLGLAEIRLAEDFSFKRAQEWSLKSENTQNSHNLCQIYGFGGDMAEYILVWRISWENGQNLVRSMGHAAIGMNKISSGEFRVFHGKWSFVSLGVTMEVY